jgi:hypothetical protein
VVVVVVMVMVTVTMTANGMSREMVPDCSWMFRAHDVRDAQR